MKRTKDIRPEILDWVSGEYSPPHEDGKKNLSHRRPHREAIRQAQGGKITSIKAKEQVKMTQEITSTTALAPVDGFDERDDAPTGGGDFVKFDAATESKWFRRDGSPVSKGPYVPIDCQKELIRWQDKKIVDRLAPQAGEPFPTADELNEKIPKSEWEEGFDGAPKGPWQLQYTIFLIDPANGAKIIAANSTTGHKIAYAELKDCIQTMRQIRGERVYPLVQLGAKPMRSKYGIKLRPSFEIIGWRGHGGAPLPALPPGKPVTPPSSDEIISDAIPF
jgi:hypothetical protein